MLTIDLEKQRVNQLRGRIKQDRQEINRLLTHWEDKPLQRSHNSVGISFAQMLAYIDKIRRSDAAADIKFLLKTYREMAERFYTQYERSLLEEIKKQADIQKYSNDIIQHIGGLPDVDPEKSALEMSIPLLEEARAGANAQYNTLTTNFPTLLQDALEKLKDEWQRLDMITVSSQILKKDKKLMRSLEAVVEIASYSVGIEAERIAIAPGDAFALYFFAYIENFAILTVPIYSVRAPWEWSIFWHELAGYKVLWLEKSTTIDKIREELIAFHTRYQAIKNDDERKMLLATITRNNIYETNIYKQKNPSITDEFSRQKNQFSQDYLGKLLDKDELVLGDLGGFEHQFERMLENLLKKDRFEMYEKIKADGWCVAWLKELFEDAWSVMAIREPFLAFFEDILRRHVVTDGRHPPVDVRLKVAQELLNLMNSESGSLKRPKSVEESAAQQILKFISLLIVASHKFERQDDQGFKFRQMYRNSLPELIGNQIGISINNWSTKFLQASDRAGEAKKGADEFINAFSAQELADFISILNASDENEKNQLGASYEKLLEGKNYRQLLELSFFEQDFLVGNSDISFGFTVGIKTYSIASKKFADNFTSFISISLSPNAPLPDYTFWVATFGNTVTSPAVIGAIKTAYKFDPITFTRHPDWFTQIA